MNDADGDGVCDELEIVGCMQLEACNWNEDATEPDDSCEFPGDACDDGDDTTINDVITADCDCVGEVDRVDEFTRWGIALFPTPVQDVMHLQFRGEAQGVGSLIIQNAAGQIIRTDRIQGDVTVDVSTLSGALTAVRLLREDELRRGGRPMDIESSVIPCTLVDSSRSSGEDLDMTPLQAELMVKCS